MKFKIQNSKFRIQFYKYVIADVILRSDVFLYIYVIPRRRSRRWESTFVIALRNWNFFLLPFAAEKVEPKPRGDKFSGSQLAVGKMVAFALLRVKRSPFLNPPPTLRPISKNSSAAFWLSPTEDTLWCHCEECSDVATDAAEREQRTSLLVLCRAARRKSHECGLISLTTLLSQR